MVLVTRTGRRRIGNWSRSGDAWRKGDTERPGSEDKVRQSDGVEWSADGPAGSQTWPGIMLGPQECSCQHH